MVYKLVHAVQAGWRRFNGQISPTCSCGAEHQLELQDARHYRSHHGAPLAKQDSSTVSKVGQVVFLQESLSTSCSRESYKTVKSTRQEGYGGSTNGRPRPR
jgi:hypothetical protein